MRKVILYYKNLFYKRQSVEKGRGKNLILVFLMVVFICTNLLSKEIKITDMDIAIVKLDKKITEIRESISELKKAVNISGENSIILTKRINDIEQKVILLDKDTDELSVLRGSIVKLEKLEIENKKEFEKIRDKIKSNEDVSRVILNDIYRLKEDIVAGRKPSYSSKKPFKEYISYISLGISIVALAVAIF
ncbi:MAG: hypothetical protein JW983_10710 [Elusimicrobia bacterium]|nr:hypothetical protein [Elusimicrobiota bacterium]